MLVFCQIVVSNLIVKPSCAALTYSDQTEDVKIIYIPLKHS